MQEITAEINRIEKRERSWFIRFGIMLGLVSTWKDRIPPLLKDKNRIKAELKPIYEEFDTRLRIIKQKREQREAVLERDEHRCQMCGREARRSRVPFHVHHVEYRSDGGSDELDNLMMLCEICHGKLPRHGLVKGERRRRLAFEKKKVRHKHRYKHS